MSIVVSSIVNVSMNKLALWISVHVDDWTDKRVIIASNVFFNVYHFSFEYFFLLLGVDEPFKVTLYMCHKERSYPNSFSLIPFIFMKLLSLLIIYLINCYLFGLKNYYTLYYE